MNETCKRPLSPAQEKVPKKQATTLSLPAPPPDLEIRT